MAKIHDLALLSVGLLTVGSAGFYFQHLPRSYASLTQPEKASPTKWTSITKEQIAEVLRPSFSQHHFPLQIADLKLEDKNLEGRVVTTIDPKLQREMEKLFGEYRPDYGAFVALDPKSGKILSLVSYSREKNFNSNLALRATFPSASVFKVITAAAAIESRKFSSDTVIPFHGGQHTLYKGQILKPETGRWTKFITLKSAFARSVNSVFGKIGAFTVGSVSLRQYAERFGFNRKINTDLPLQQSQANIPEDAWGIAESASGYTLENKMSPLQGALIAACVANDGVMMEPFIVDSIRDLEGKVVYSSAPKVANVALEPSTATQLKMLMRETVAAGTSKRSFRGFFKKKFSFVDVGGKTGSLTGYDPKGKYDWFVGYATYGNQRFAVAALTIHGRHWRVKSAYLARRAIENYFDESVKNKTVAHFRE